MRKARSIVQNHLFIGLTVCVYFTIEMALAYSLYLTI